MFANYHTHTTRCRHAVGEDREYVEAAIASGLKILGFSDHCPWIYPDGFVSGIRLSPQEVDGYFSSLEKLKKEYENDIKLYIGFESEYCAPLQQAQEEFLKDYPVDYMILGQHFLGLESESVYVGAMTAQENSLIRYVDIVLEGLATGQYLYLAHPDVLHFVGDDDTFKKHMRRLLSYLKEKNIPAEINLQGLADNRHYPSVNYFELLKEIGNDVILGIDAHDPALLLNKEIQEKASALCRQYGLNVIDRDLLTDKPAHKPYSV